MELNLVKTTPGELPDDASFCVAITKHPFTFLWFRGCLLMNRNMKGIRKLTAAVETMWKYEDRMTEEAMAAVDAAYEIIRQTAGDHAAKQAWDAWWRDSSAIRKAKTKEKTLAWISAGNAMLTDEECDLLESCGYDYSLIDTGFFDAYRELREKNPNHPAYKDYFSCAARAAFAYGFRLGQAAATEKEAAV